MPGPTNIPVGSPLAVKRYSGALFTDVKRKSYWDRRFVGNDMNSVIQRLTDLESSSGDDITYDLSAQLREPPITGDNRAEGKEEDLQFYSDEILIDQMRKPVSAGGKMAQKRTLHNLRMVAKQRLAEYWAAYIDQMHFIYLSGARGTNADFYENTAWAGHAGNAIQAPDTSHQLYGGDATSKASIDASDKMSVSLIERLEVQAKTMRTEDVSTANMMPVDIGEEKHYVCVMSPFQEHDIRNADTNGWVAIQRAAAAAEGRKNPIFRGGLGMVKNVVLHSHESVIRFSDYGATTNLPAARALFLGRQAGVIAFGSSKRMRFDWVEEKADLGNELIVSAGVILGVKKSRFNNKDFGVLAADTYAKNPNS